MQKMIVLFGCIILFSQCKKSNNSQEKPYVPLTVGSNWTYLNSPGGTSTLTVTNKDTVAGNPARTYKVLSNSNGPNDYLTTEGSDHYRFSTLGGVLPEGYSDLYLKDNAGVNATWLVIVPVNFQGFPVNVNNTYRVNEKGISKTVMGKNYNDVVHVKLEVTANILGSVQNFGGGDFFYAKGVGMIYYNIALSGIPGSVPINQTSELVSHQIK